MRNNWIFASIIAFLLVSGVACWLYRQNRQAQMANWKMMENQARAVANVSSNLIESGDTYLPQILALEILPQNLENPNRPYVPEAECLLRSASIINTALFKSSFCTGITSLKINNNTVFTTSTDDSLRVWDINTGRLIKSSFLSKETSEYIFNKDCKRVAGISRYDNSIYVWDTRNGELINKFVGHDNIISSIIFSDDGKKLFSASYDKTVKEWDVATSECTKTIFASDSIFSISLSPNEQDVVCGMGIKLCVYNLHNGKCTKILKSLSGICAYNVVWGEDDNTIYSTSDTCVYIFNLKFGESKKILTKHSKYIMDISVSPNGRYILTASYDGTLELYDCFVDKCIKSFNGHKGPVVSCEISSGCNFVLSASLDGSLRCWPIDVNFYKKKSCSYLSVESFSNNNKYIACCKGDTIELMNVKTGKTIQTFIGHTSSVNTILFSKNDKVVLSASYDKTIRLWDVETGQCLKKFVGHQKDVDHAFFCFSEKYILSSSLSEWTSRVWNVSTGECVKILNGYVNAFYEKNNHVFISLGCGKMAILDLNTYTFVHDFHGYNITVKHASFSSSGQYIFIVNYRNEVSVWDARTGDLIVSRKTSDGFYEYKYSTDGKNVIFAMRDGTIIVKDFVTGESKLNVKVLSDEINSVCFSPNGRYIALTSGNMIKIIDFPPLQELIDQTRERFKNRQLTPEERRTYYLE